MQPETDVESASLSIPHDSAFHFSMGNNTRPGIWKRRSRLVFLLATISLFCGIIAFILLTPRTVAIWCIGDSITDGYTATGPLASGGWRSDLNRQFAKSQSHVAWIGSVTDGSGIAHDGHCGWTLDQLASLVATMPLKRTPDIVIVSGGTNDIAYGLTPTQISYRLWSLLWAVHDRAPTAKILVWSILPSQTGNTSFDAVAKSYNAMMPDVVKSVATRTGQPVFFVDMARHAKLTPSDYSDRQHPNIEGYLKMSTIFNNAISPIVTTQ